MNLLELKKELEPYKNTLVLCDLDGVYRLDDVIFDSIEEDFYWVMDSKLGIFHLSCVLGWIPLKGYIKQNEYDRLVNIWNLNNKIKAI